ncbi:MAG TPA: response regulator [Rhodothermales bacterium]|nr:response regulator [Rhodothermales bacterium]
MALPHEQSPAPNAASSPVVVVVDDDAGMRAYIRQCLMALPVRIEEATDGQDALEQIQAMHSNDVALVISDLYMPRMDGRVLKATLRADPHWRQVPVLLITGEAIHARDGPLLRKPFNARKLRAVVQALLDLS